MPQLSTNPRRSSRQSDKQSVPGVYAAFLALVFALFCSTHAEYVGAVEVSSLYTAQVPWDSSARDGRERAYAQALREVLVKVTGSREAAGGVEMAQLFPEPSRFVSGYRAGPNQTLWVSFDGRSLAASLRDSGAPVWDSNRPLTLVWLALDRGRLGRSLAGDGDGSGELGNGRSVDPNNFLRERLESAAAMRGIPMMFPLLDASDRESVEFADVWGGFDERILQASQRYGAPSILVGRATVEPGRDPRIRWTWHFGGERQEFSTDIDNAAHRVADTMASQLAVSGSTEHHDVELDVSGLTGVESYGRVMRLLNSLPQLRSVDVTSVQGSGARFRIAAVGSLEQIERALSSSGILIAESVIAEDWTDPAEELDDYIDESATSPAPTATLRMRYGH